MAPPSPAGARRIFSPTFTSSPHSLGGEDIELPELDINEDEGAGEPAARSPHFAPLPGGTRVAPSTPARPSAIQPAGSSAALTHTCNSPLNPNPTLTSTAPSTAASAAPPTPILAHTPGPKPDSDRPEFAELLTPAQLRRRRRPHATLAPDAPAGLGTLAGQPLLAGSSRLGWTTDDGDLYRGATADPTPEPAKAVSNDDAVTVSTGSSSSSSWSWGSGGVAGATRAVVHRIGGAIGVRRGSMSTVDTGYASSASSSSSDGAATRVIGRLGRALTRTVSRGTMDSTEERPRRVYVPLRREFTLLLPDENWTPGEATPLPTPPLEGTTPASTPTRVITTPVLQPILEEVRKARAAAGITSDLVLRQSQSRRRDVAMRRAGSAPGRQRQPRAFTAPPPRRPVVPPTVSRLEALRGTPSIPAPVRPKSASDLLGMVGTRSDSTTSLRGLVEESETKTSSPRRSIDTFDKPFDKPRAAWWLDVSCPTWKDLRDIGELLSLHPLTLEDVLHQDPREKLDTFDALGYYFVVVRALDEQYFKYTPGGADAPPGAGITAPGVHPAEEPVERQRRGWGFGRATGRAASKSGEKVEIVEDNPGKEGLEGVAVGGINLYLAVFADGIFHFGDVSKHMTRVRNRLLSVRTHEPTSDWIAHGLLDSIVDAFFPLTGYVDGAVDDMDALSIDPTRDPRDHHHRAFTIDDESPSDAPYADHVEDLVDGHMDTEWIAMDDKEFMDRRKSRREKVTKRMNRVQLHAKKSAVNRWVKKAFVRAFAPSRFDATTATSPFAHVLLYIKLFLLPITDARPTQYMTAAPELFDRTTVLNSMNNLRRLVTGLSRLLGGKHMVVASLLKRVESHTGGTSDVGAYLSDVHDHILLLQTSLYHYEYILANCQPAYISHLHVSGSTSRGNISTLVLALSVVTIGTLPMQFVTGMFSMNVYVPHNLHPADKIELDLPGPLRLNLFGIVVAIVVVVACCLVLMIRWWRWKARQKWSRRRGFEVPNAWNGFWGWE
ncbi:hypothetical protein CcaverHIS641_0510180 [Cutaneotrichosporon cavernicola]|nr:hypothetical protein CcaverHIS641_0510180 [Cutaneotrichosporon cavernicola]